MGTRWVLALSMACSTGPSTTIAPAEDPPPARKVPPQAAPGPAPGETGPTPSAGSQWRTEGGRVLAFSEGQATFDGRPMARDGQRLGQDGFVRLVTPCDLALYAEERWVEARRTSPPCADGEGRFDGVAHTTWDLPTGDRYSLLPGGQAWRRGPKRYFNHPSGTWTADGARVTFGGSTFELVPLDACHRVFRHTKTGGVHRADRTFPVCDPAERTYADLDWTLWAFPNGDLLDVRSGGAAQIDVLAQTEPVPLTMTGVEGGFRLTTADGAVRSFAVSDCTATEAGSELTLTRQYPSCSAN